MPEPILWAHKADRSRSIPAKRWNPETKSMEPAYDEDTGAPLREKVPQRGHDGKPADYDNPSLARIPRWMHVLRHDGAAVRVPITMAAADAEGSDYFGKYVRAKAVYFGWIPVGHCPAAMLIAGTLRKQQIVSDEARAATPCVHGSYGENRHCPHYTLEAAARQLRQSKRQGKIDKAFQSEAEKLIKAQQQQTVDIVQGVAGAMAEAMKSIAAASSAQHPPPALPAGPEAPPPADPKERKKP